MRAYSNDSEESEMANLGGRAIYRTVLMRILAWGALAVCASASPALAQNSIAGNFTLNEKARFGNSVLAAGHYKFSIEPIGTIQSIHTIQQGAGHLVLVVIRPEKSGPTASIFAMASPSEHAREASELILEPERTGTLAQAMYLRKAPGGLQLVSEWEEPSGRSENGASAISRGAANCGNLLEGRQQAYGAGRFPGPPFLFGLVDCVRGDAFLLIGGSALGLRGVNFDATFKVRAVLDADPCRRNVPNNGTIGLDVYAVASVNIADHFPVNNHFACVNL